MRIAVVGPGRAGGSLAVAARDVGHEIVGVLVRRDDDRAVADHLGLEPRPIGVPVPEADLLIVSVRDDAIPEVAGRLARAAGRIAAAVHLSGLVAVSALAPLADAGLDTGAFHPLQTLPDWRTGARTLRGAYVGISAENDLSGTLENLACSLGCRPFHVANDQKPLYHAAATAAANYVLAALGLAEELFSKAGVDHRVARPLVEQTVANAFDIGVAESLTGPIARGDLETVRRQLRTVGSHAPLDVEAFKAFARATARVAGREPEIEEILRGDARP